MAIVQLPDELARRPEAEAARRGVTVDELAVEALRGRCGPESAEQQDSHALAQFVGMFESGDSRWTSSDAKVLRAAAARHTD